MCGNFLIGNYLKKKQINECLKHPLSTQNKMIILKLLLSVKRVNLTYHHAGFNKFKE